MTLRSRVSWNSVVSFFSLTGVQFIKFLGSIAFVNIAGSAAVGIYFVFMSVYRILNRGTTLGMGQSIVKRVSELGDSPGGEMTDTVVTAFLLRSLPLLTVTAALAVLGGPVNQYIGLDYAWLLVAGSLWLTALYSTLRSTLIGTRKVDVASAFDLLKDGGTAVVQVALVVIGYAQWGLAVGFVIGMLVSGLSLLLYVRLPVHTASVQTDRARSLLSFAKFSYLDNLVGGEYRWLDVVILGFFVTPSLIGVYGIAYTLAQFGLIFSVALGRNVLPEASHLSSTDRFEERERLLYRSLSYSTLFPFPILAGSLVLADRLLTDIYALDSGGTVLVVLTAGAVAYAAYQQLHQFVYALDMPEYAFMLSALSTAVNAVVALVLVPVIGILGAAISTSLSMAASLLVGVYLVRTRCRVRFQLPFRPWALQAACSAIMGLVVFAIHSQLVLKTRFYSTLIVLCGATVYLCLIISVDSFLRMQLRRLFTRLVASGDRNQ